MTYKVFTKNCNIHETVEAVFAWHERHGALERLTPSWMTMKNIRKTGGIETGSAVSMKMAPAAFPLPLPFFISMAAEHIAYEKNHFFRDRLIRCPFLKWEHTHTFSSRGKGLSQLEDRVHYALPIHIPRTWAPLVENELHRLFSYRHRVMMSDLERHKAFKSQDPDTASRYPAAATMGTISLSTTPIPLNIVISGASGTVGNALVPFLTTGGHRVIQLVRRAPLNSDEIQWNPYNGELDLTPAGKIDVIINLNGHHIGSGRWTDKTKELIIKSRNLSTSLLADCITALPSDRRPELFISASATGFYGDCGDSCINENSCCGDLFISRVCDEWEASARSVEDAGIRTVFARMGVVLTPAGGALQRMLPGFLMGLGAKIGTGAQYMSWISMDDLVYSLYHIISHREINGAVNLASPNPVTNAEFTRILGKVLSRPAPFTLPAFLIKLLWGKMGEEVLLASTCAMPDRLLASGFKFSYPDLVQTLAHVLGKEKI